MHDTCAAQKLEAKVSNSNPTIRYHQASRPNGAQERPGTAHCSIADTPPRPTTMSNRCPDAQPDAQPDAKPDPRPDAQPDARPDALPDS